LKDQLPKIGFLVCNSGSSNTGTLTGIVAYGMIKEFDGIAIFSLPALANRIPKQIALIKKVPRLIVIDGCKNECAKKNCGTIGYPLRDLFEFGSGSRDRKNWPLYHDGLFRRGHEKSKRGGQANDC